MTAPPLVEILGIVAIATMVTCYALERRGTFFIAAFAAGCSLAAVYAYLIDSYPFLIAEGIWAVVPRAAGRPRGASPDAAPDGARQPAKPYVVRRVGCAPIGTISY